MGLRGRGGSDAVRAHGRVERLWRGNAHSVDVGHETVGVALAVGVEADQRTLIVEAVQDGAPDALGVLSAWSSPSPAGSGQPSAMAPTGTSHCRGSWAPTFEAGPSGCWEPATSASTWCGSAGPSAWRCWPTRHGREAAPVAHRPRPLPARQRHHHVAHGLVQQGGDRTHPGHDGRQHSRFPGRLAGQRGQRTALSSCGGGQRAEADGARRPSTGSDLCICGARR